MCLLSQISYLTFFICFIPESCCKYRYYGIQSDKANAIIPKFIFFELQTLTVFIYFAFMHIYDDFASDGNCTFPSTWDAGWYDSGMGDVTMSNISLAITSGWIVNAYSVPVTSWTCVSGDTSNNTMLFK